jgi:hypothetical protein
VAILSLDGRAIHDTVTVERVLNDAAMPSGGCGKGVLTVSEHAIPLASNANETNRRRVSLARII